MAEPAACRAAALRAAPGWLALVVASGLQAAPAAAAYFPVRLVNVPSVVGLPRDDAQTRIEAVGLRPLSTPGLPPPVASAVVTSQNPAAGASLGQGRFVDLTFGPGAAPGRVDVPDIVGLTPSQAAKRLLAAGLRLGERSGAMPYARGALVASSTPAQGETAPRGSRVGYTLRAGFAQVPPVVGLTEAAASAALARRGFAPRGDLSAGRLAIVHGQSPDAGTEASVGSSVTLVLATGAPRGLWVLGAALATVVAALGLRRLISPTPAPAVRVELPAPQAWLAEPPEPTGPSVGLSWETTVAPPQALPREEA